MSWLPKLAARAGSGQAWMIANAAVVRVSSRPVILSWISSAVLAVVLLVQQPPNSRPAPHLELLDTVVIASARLAELSGVAPSHQAGFLWTHNDSGDGPLLYAVDTTGRDLGGWRITGAVNRDWEDMAAGPCTTAPGRCLYLGDIGDNLRRRPSIVVYRVAEPSAPSGAAEPLPLLDSIVLRYPGAPHNAEGIALTPDGRLLVAVKDTRGPALLFTAPAATREAVLAPLCTLDLRVEPFTGRIVTGLAVSPDGGFIVARTYVSLHVFRADSRCTPLTPPAGMVIPVVESQGEAVAFDAPDRLVLVSERGEANHAIMTRLRLLGLP